MCPWMYIRMERCACLRIRASSFLSVCSNTNSDTPLSRNPCLHVGVCLCTAHTPKWLKEKGGKNKKCSHGSAVSSMMPSICLVAPVKLMRWVSEGGLVEAEVSQEPVLPDRLLCCEAEAQGLTATLVAAQPPGKAWHTARPSATHEHTRPSKDRFTLMYVWATCPFIKHEYWHIL